MQVQSFSHTGSIRDDNQDHLLLDSDLRLAIIADGHGAAGKTLAEYTANAICERLREIAPVTGSDESRHRLHEAYNLAIAAAPTGLAVGAHCDIAAVWINRGIAAVFATGTCRLLSALPQQNWLEQREFALPVAAGIALLLVSEGAAAALSSQQLQPALNDLLTAANTNTDVESNVDSFTAFEQQTAAVYDGDDCSAILLKLDQTDLTAGIPHEIELFEHYNRTWSCKLWLPLSLAAGAGLATLAAARKLKPLLDRLKS